MSIKFGANYPLVKGILNCNNKGSGPLQKGDNKKKCKKLVKSLKKRFLRTIEPE
jgi:hypothetical protein